MTECPACDPKPVQASTPAAASVQAIPEVVAAVVLPAQPVTQIPVPAAAPVLSSAPESKPPDELPMDPLLVLAERIRAAQLAAQPVRAPQLRELAAAVGSSEAPTLELIPVPVVARPTPGTLALAERAQPAALLAPPRVEAPPAPVALAEPIPAPLPLVAFPQRDPSGTSGTAGGGRSGRTSRTDLHSASADCSAGNTSRADRAGRTGFRAVAGRSARNPSGARRAAGGIRAGCTG